MLEKALPILEANFDSEHGDVYGCYRSLSTAYFKTGQYAKASDYLKKIVVIQMKVFGVDDERTKETKHAISVLENAAHEQPVNSENLADVQHDIPLSDRSAVKEEAEEAPKP